jgi:hypothetical protein
MQDSCSFSCTQASDIVILDIPRGDLVEISSSSYGLSSFSLNAGSRRAEGARAVPGRSSSVNIGELRVQRLLRRGALVLVPPKIKLR